MKAETISTREARELAVQARDRVTGMYSQVLLRAKDSQEHICITIEDGERFDTLYVNMFRVRRKLNLKGEVYIKKINKRSFIVGPSGP